MRLENHDAGFETQPVGSLFQTGEHCLMTQMHPIKISDGKCNRGFGFNGNTAANAHDVQPLKC
jgi:hypothetical protein